MTPLITQQPREYISQYGAERLTLEQAVALILGSGSRQYSISSLSPVVAESLSQGRRTVSELRAIPGMGLAKAASLVAALSLSNLLDRPQLSELLVGPEAVYLSCYDLLDLPQEHLIVFFLSVRNRKIRRELVTIGTSTASVVHPREVFRAAIIHNAYSIILAHNHPSGDPQPSGADCQVTKRIAEAGREVGIELLDHVICARTGFVSLKETMPNLFP